MSNWIEQLEGAKRAAAVVAPVLRSLFPAADGQRLIIYSETESSADLEFDGAACESADELYTKLAQASAESELPESILVKGLGRFVFKAAGTKSANPRLRGKVSLVTGGAQGFGEGIARELAAAGAHVVIADLNLELAQSVVASINEQYGENAALALSVNVGDEDSVRDLMEEITLNYGGLDLLVSNAGVLKAGALEEMTLKSFEFVTRINYTAFFLVSKYGSRPMKLQARFDKNYMGDIVQINSKSGLEGSNKNFAYAGSKFGGIGLVQSFAKELVEDRIKVNAICPGNYYEGPLWSDPEKGLFVQYLEAGKVPGAKTVEDVYEFYVSKVPMRKGCSPLDVTRAIMYCVEQQNETGQAIPVTGGQTMLK
jgi:NAD(P)-dependent dehydrogenase (short-subunit alcohol dehydrogenase family)